MNLDLLTAEQRKKLKELANKMSNDNKMASFSKDALFTLNKGEFMKYISLGKHYEGMRKSINCFIAPFWKTDDFQREIQRYIQPTGDVSKMVALARIIKMKGGKYGEAIN